MKKDEQSLLRMNFLIQAARLYQVSFPEYSSHFVYDFVQMSQKKIIRIDKNLKKKIDKKRFTLKNAKHLAKFIPIPKPKEPHSHEEKMQIEAVCKDPLRNNVESQNND